MTLKIAIQMDPIADIDIVGDTTFAFALEAQARGAELYYYTPDDMIFDDGILKARVARLQVADVVGAYFDLSVAAVMVLSAFDVILLRQDPPFDMSYITTTHFLETLRGQVLVVNDPVAVRNAPEKLLPMRFTALTPPTLMGREHSAFVDFRALHGDIIVKPLYGNGGADVFHIRTDDDNFNALLELFLARSRTPIIAQKYISAVRSGDKRVILIDGEAVGVLNRLPADGDARANLHVGGTAQAGTITTRDQEIVASIAPTLRDMNIVLAGIDIIDGYLTEINVTSPTGVREIKALCDLDIAPIFWDAVEKRLEY